MKLNINIIYILILFIIQWLSITVIILNALYWIGVQEFVMGFLSLVIASGLLFFYILYIKLLSKLILNSQTIISVVIISIWTIMSISHFNGSFVWLLL